MIPQMASIKLPKAGHITEGQISSLSFSTNSEAMSRKIFNALFS
jgi:hypothetical protein